MAANSRATPPFFPYYELHLSLKYLRSRFSSVAALLSVTFGVAVILIVLSIMGGYVTVLRETIRGQESHLTIYGSAPFSVTHVVELEELIRGVKSVKGTAPFIETLAMYKSGALNPCQLRGIHPRRELEVSEIGRYVLRPEELERVLPEIEATDEAPGGGSDSRARSVVLIDSILRASERKPIGPDELEKFFEPELGIEILRMHNPGTLKSLGETRLPAAIVGVQFLLEHKVLLGGVVEIGTVKPDQSSAAGEQFANRSFVVVGAFKTGDYDFDSRSIFVHVDYLKNMLELFDPRANTYRYEGIRVAVDDLNHVTDAKKELKARLQAVAPWLQVLTWEDLKGNVLTAVVIEKFVIYFLLVLLMTFTGCMVLLMLLLTVIEKTRDMGVLLALGARPGGVVSIFLMNGLIIVVAGTVLGLLIGYVFCFYINPLHDWIHAVTGLRLFPPEIYHMDRIPISFQPLDVLLSTAPPLVLGFLASLIPALWASRRDPIKAIHYE